MGGAAALLKLGCSLFVLRRQFLKVLFLERARPLLNISLLSQPFSLGGRARGWIHRASNANSFERASSDLPPQSCLLPL